MRPPWRSRPRRGIPAAPSGPSFSPQRAGCLLKTLACEGLYFFQRPASPVIKGIQWKSDETKMGLDAFLASEAMFSDI